MGKKINDQAVRFDIAKMNELLHPFGIEVGEIVDNTVALDTYIHTSFRQSDGFKWTTWVPYLYRRTNINLKTNEELMEYLVTIKRCFTEENMSKWRREVGQPYLKAHPKAFVTNEFFKKLMSFMEEEKFVPTTNPQRRLQFLKDAGFTIAILPKRASDGKSSVSIMLPLPQYHEIVYETISQEFKKRVKRLLGGIDAYENVAKSGKHLVIDHKFSEIRWDDDTSEDNTMSMTDEEIIRKFQLLDNQRNLQKREVCRQCLKTKMRGTIFGIKYFYKGTEHWDMSIPEKGKEAEKGCEGCPWYDIEEWRREINDKLNHD